MDRRTTPTQLLVAQSCTPATQDTSCWGVLIEFASQPGSGLESILLALVSNKHNTSRGNLCQSLANVLLLNVM